MYVGCVHVVVSFWSKRWPDISDRLLTVYVC